TSTTPSAPLTMVVQRCTPLWVGAKSGLLAGTGESKNGISTSFMSAIVTLAPFFSSCFTTSVTNFSFTLFCFMLMYCTKIFVIINATPFWALVKLYFCNVNTNLFEHIAPKGVHFLSATLLYTQNTGLNKLVNMVAHRRLR